MFTLTIEDSNGQLADQFSFDHGSYVIGRLDECDVVLPSSSVSRKHARIFVQNGRCYVEDLQSANGVMVDGQKVVQQRDLGTASQIRVGDYYLYLEYKQQASHSEQNVLNTLFINNDADHNKLVRIRDSFAGEEFSLSEIENTIGRTDDNFILLSDSSISRHHAKIIRDGDKYTVVDLDSSNGTRLNGKKVTTPRALNRGDVVEFGSVEFVFTTGDDQFDASNPPAPKEDDANRLVVIGGLVALVAVGLAIGGMIVFGFFSMKESQSGAAPQAPVESADNSVESQVQELLADGKSQMRRREWVQAISTFEEVLALAPKHPAASTLRERARLEKQANELLNKGEELSEQGRHEDAKDILEQLPEDTVAFDRAQPTLEHVNKTLAYNLKNEASRLIRDGGRSSLAKAHKKLVRALSMFPDDKKALELVEELEGEMEKKRMDFEPYARR